MTLRNLAIMASAGVLGIALAGCGSDAGTGSDTGTQSNGAATSLVCQFVTGGSPPTVGITLTVAASTNPNACGILADGLVNNNNIAGWTATTTWPFTGAAVCSGAYPGGTGTLQDAAATASADALAICANLGWQ